MKLIIHSNASNKDSDSTSPFRRINSEYKPQEEISVQNNKQNRSRSSCLMEVTFWKSCLLWEWASNSSQAGWLSTDQNVATSFQILLLI